MISELIEKEFKFNLKENPYLLEREISVPRILQYIKVSNIKSIKISAVSAVNNDVFIIEYTTFSSEKGTFHYSINSTKELIERKVLLPLGEI